MTPQCERCGAVPAREFVPDQRDGWKRPRRLCARCADEVLEQRRKEQR